MSLPAWTRRPNSPPVSQSTPVAGILLWITVNWGELGQTGWLGTGRGNGDNSKDKHNISPDTWKKGCPDSPHLAQFTPTVPNHPHGQYICPRLCPRPCPRPHLHLRPCFVLLFLSLLLVLLLKMWIFMVFDLWPLTFETQPPNVVGLLKIRSKMFLAEKW